ncbi:phospholipid-translocating P-type ATPase, flippase [Allomyces macrogynus ATCC 38327]|uniref:Phospholipid-transporting ATPase n=1 Tax=Allomyces macrogynus (strain ATCC 38327) TaxID=578462 RepID=A0A0L0S215_ALLM3|nr:phospholipid-translocating P-type ATPase, flippase [Allomyces macrogynus ATCC 38327]|eukprot:KNE56612.1 phospholipid-translocating P-type ATPase, flippase [Allomyces macrogynus ATCC 38327]
MPRARRLARTGSPLVSMASAVVQLDNDNNSDLDSFGHVVLFPPPTLPPSDGHLGQDAPATGEPHHRVAVESDRIAEAATSHQVEPAQQHVASFVDRTAESAPGGRAHDSVHDEVARPQLQESPTPSPNVANAPPPTLPAATTPLAFAPAPVPLADAQFVPAVVDVPLILSPAPAPTPTPVPTPAPAAPPRHASARSPPRVPAAASLPAAANPTPPPRGASTHASAPASVHDRAASPAPAPEQLPLLPPSSSSAGGQITMGADPSNSGAVAPGPLHVKMMVTTPDPNGDNGPAGPPPPGLPSFDPAPQHDTGGGGGGGGSGGGMVATLSRTLQRMSTVLSSTPAPTFRTVPIHARSDLAGTDDAPTFLHNGISTAKYTPWSFLPKFLREQFGKYANVFFLFTACIQQIPGISPTNRFDTITPLTVVLLFTAAKEIAEDLRRHRADDEVNQCSVQVLGRDAQLRTVVWRDVAVGDIVRVENGESFPADLVLLASSEQDGLCYIETANLDGETNLKIKQARPETTGWVHAADLAGVHGRIECELPNSSLYTFEGTMHVDGLGAPIALDPKQVLLRGARLRNTHWICGVVVYTGHETKLMRNASAAPIKTTALEGATNRQILVLCGLLLFMALACSVGTQVLTAEWTSTAWYLLLGEASLSPVVLFLSNLATFWVLFNNLIPISLIVTMEMVKFANADLIASDLQMYYVPADMPAVVRTSSLVEELGQVQYIFSDKTGTLTCNIMQFMECTIGGVRYAESVPEPPPDAPMATFASLRGRLAYAAAQSGGMGDHDATAHEFLTLLSVCHTVLPEIVENGSVVYQASSPDEAALVSGAADLGYKFVARKPNSVTIEVRRPRTDSHPDDVEAVTYTVLAVNEFNSTRKRMSVLVERNGEYRLYVKGADNVILARLDQNHLHTIEQQAPTLHALEYYATQGLRTLTLAYRQLTKAQADAWLVEFDQASTTLVNRGDALMEVAEAIEKDLVLLGATAIEDKLQDGVPETIATLAKANLKLWVLTGDRQETAINIGFSCRLLTPSMVLLIINEPSPAAIARRIDEHKATMAADPDAEYALVIEGASLAHVLPDETPVASDAGSTRSSIKKKKSAWPWGAAKKPKAKAPVVPVDNSLTVPFAELACACHVVIACRTSPLQKSQVVKMVKAHVNAITLAIGDGANDVSMIQAAHIGIGISGQEGLQAARAADVAIGQFRYLQRLLLVHGCYAYHRLVKLILFSFYKNITLYLTQFWFAVFNGFSGQTVYETWILTGFNVFFTSIPPLALGIFDKVIDEDMLESTPSLYTVHQSGRKFNVKVFAMWLVNALYHSTAIFFGTAYVFGTWDLGTGTHGGTMGDHVRSDGVIGGVWILGVVMYTCTLVTVLLKAMLITSYWAAPWTFLAIFGSLALWIAFLPIYAIVGGKMISLSPELVGAESLYVDSRFWLAVVLVSVLVLLRDLAVKFYRHWFRPLEIHVRREEQKLLRRERRRRVSGAVAPPRRSLVGAPVELAAISTPVPPANASAPLGGSAPAMVMAGPSMGSISTPPPPPRVSSASPMSTPPMQRTPLSSPQGTPPPPRASSAATPAHLARLTSLHRSSYAFSQSPGQGTLLHFDSARPRPSGL